LAPENRWYRRGTQENLDVERTWWLIRTLVRDTDVEMILLDQSLSALVERFAIAAGEEKEWVQGIFHNRNGRYAIVRHAAGHATHLHIRFFNPVAQESGRRLMPMLVERRIVTPPQKTVTHVVRPGETLAKLAARYGTTMQAIRDANAMHTYQLVAGKAYRIPVAGSTTETPRAQIPSRRAQSSSTRKN
jgi:penicillin-insensitive murein endopeptidase